MTKANLRLLLISTVAAGSTFAAAQTTTHPTTTHHTTSTTHHTAAAHRAPAKSECVAVPELSPTIPALPAGSPCPRALFTISERLDYVSPMVGPEVKENFANLPMIFTLAYVDTKVGTGELARPHMWYTVQYTGYLPDGTKFDSSFDHPETRNGLSFPYGAHQVIPGWDTGFEGMRIGGKRRLFIPYQLAYGERGRPPVIPARAELVFDMELISQNAENPNPRPAGPPMGARPGMPGQPGSLPATPPTGAAPGTAPNTAPGTTPQSARPQSARPQTGPDVKPVPPSPGSSTPPPQPPQPPAKQPPPSAQ